MSNIYIQEPPTHGKVMLETTCGDIDIELWSREAPKATRNFIQLCMEGYYDNTLFHRLVKGFIVQGGDPTGTGTGGTSVWGKTFKDEIHSRLRFVRRGLVAMANAGRDDNGSQFFFTLGPTPELQNKHTIFGKVAGDTIYNMIKLEEGVVDDDERPLYPHKILRTKVLSNPFDDIVPRASIKSLSKQDLKPKGSKMAATKNFQLLSFGDEAEDEEEEINQVNVKFSGKSKSSHDLISDPKLSKQPALVLEPSSSSTKPPPPAAAGKGSDEEEELAEEKSDKKESSEATDEYLKLVKDKLSSKNRKDKDVKLKTKPEEPKEEYYLGKAEKESDKKHLEEIKKEIRDLKRSMKKGKEQEIDLAEEKKKQAEASQQQNEVIKEFLEEQKVYKERKKDTSKKGDDREAQTLALLQKFKSKISTAKETFGEANPEAIVEEEDVESENPKSIAWLSKPLHSVANELELAKDANLKSDDWFEIYDPRNPLNKRRREGNKLHEKIKKLKPTD